MKVHAKYNNPSIYYVVRRSMTLLDFINRVRYAKVIRIEKNNLVARFRKVVANIN